MKYSGRKIRSEYKQQVEKAISVFITDYPIIKQMVKIIHCKKVGRGMEYCFATSRISWGLRFGYEIKLNPKAFSKPEIKNKFKMTYDANYESISDVIYHELGHCLQPFILCDKWELDLKKYYYFNYIKYAELEAGPKAVKVYEEYFCTFMKKIGWNHKEIENHLGKYAASDWWEMLPECFNNYYRLKEKNYLDATEQETYKFVKAVVEDYKKYVPDKI